MTVASLVQYMENNMCLFALLASFLVLSEPKFTSRLFMGKQLNMWYFSLRFRSLMFDHHNSGRVWIMSLKQSNFFCLLHKLSFVPILRNKIFGKKCVEGHHCILARVLKNSQVISRDKGFTYNENRRDLERRCEIIIGSS